MNQPTPNRMNTISVPEPEDFHDQPIDLVDELTQRALLAHKRSYKGGSFSEFYDSCTQNCIPLLTEAMVKEALALSNEHHRPLDKVLRAAAKALAAMQIAITQREEESQ